MISVPGKCVMCGDMVQSRDDLGRCFAKCADKWIPQSEEKELAGKMADRQRMFGSRKDED